MENKDREGRKGRKRYGKEKRGGKRKTILKQDIESKLCDIREHVEVHSTLGNDRRRKNTFHNGEKSGH